MRIGARGVRRLVGGSWRVNARGTVVGVEDEMDRLHDAGKEVLVLKLQMR